jgi:pyrroline-5-carboxylate reductase
MNFSQNSSDSTSSLSGKKIAVIGVGKIGGTLVSSLLKNKVIPPSHLFGSTRHSINHEKISSQLGIKLFTHNSEMAKLADIVILAVKPQNMKQALSEIKNSITTDQMIVTLAAATTTRFVEEILPDKIPVIRAMPNTPCLVNEGMTVLCPGKSASLHHLKMAKQIFSSVGRVEVLDNEDLMDAVTALSGSGPGYIYIMIESLAEGGVKAGLPRDLATTLAAQSMLGASKMVLETGEHPAKLKDSVTTPAGVTMDGIMELEDGGIRVTLIKAIAKATEKAKEISQ